MNDEILNRVGKRFGSLEDLPPELQRELNVKMDELETRIIVVIKEVYEGYASIDEILVGLFRRYGTILKRTELANKIYRMSRGELIRAVPKRKGIYTLE